MSAATAPADKAARPPARSGAGGAFDRVAGLLPNWAWGLFFLALAIAYGIVGDELEVPFVDGQALFESIIQTLAYVMMALGLNIVVGFAGLLDLGYVAFFAIGAFVAGWFMSGFFDSQDIHILATESARALPGIHLNFFFVAAVAAAFTALWGAILGAPTLRLRGDYLAIVTLAFGEIVPRVFEFSEQLGLDVSNGRQGITPVDKPYFPLPFLDDITRIDIRPFYFIALAMMLLVLFLNIRLRDSRLGRAWIATREDEVAAAAMGINLVRVKLWAYAIGAAIGGFAGAFLGVFQNTINVDQFEFGFSVFILCMVILGGMGNLAGVILGAVALSMINRFLLPELDGLPEKVGLDFDVTAISFGIFGFLLLVMMVLRPEGLIPNRRRKIELHQDDEDSDAEDLYSVKSSMAENTIGAGNSTVAENGANGFTGDNVLEATGVSKRFGGLVAVNDVDFAVPRKGIVSIIGPNGAGKTTFFNCMTGLYKPTAGRVLFDGQDITSKAPHLVTQAGVARTFQNIKLFKTMTVLENVMVGRHSRMKARITGSVIGTPFVRREERDTEEFARELLRLVGIPRRHQDLAASLPYGDQRRLEIARALASGPKLLLLDEPTAGMNPQESSELTALMEKLRTEQDISVLLIEHDMKVVMEVSDHITVLDGGEKIAAGSPQEVRKNPRVIEAYLGSQA